MNPYRKRQKNNRRRAIKRGTRCLDAIDRALRQSGANWAGWRTKRHHAITEMIGRNMTRAWRPLDYAALASKKFGERQDFGWLGPVPPELIGERVV